MDVQVAAFAKGLEAQEAGKTTVSCRPILRLEEPPEVLKKRKKALKILETRCRNEIENYDGALRVLKYWRKAVFVDDASGFTCNINDEHIRLLFIHCCLIKGPSSGTGTAKKATICGLVNLFFAFVSSIEPGHIWMGDATAQRVIKRAIRIKLFESRESKVDLLWDLHPGFEELITAAQSALEATSIYQLLGSTSRLSDCDCHLETTRDLSVVAKDTKTPCEVQELLLRLVGALKDPVAMLPVGTYIFRYKLLPDAKTVRLIVGLKLASADSLFRMGTIFACEDPAQEKSFKDFWSDKCKLRTLSDARNVFAVQWQRPTPTIEQPANELFDPSTSSVLSQAINWICDNQFDGSLRFIGGWRLSDDGRMNPEEQWLARAVSDIQSTLNSLQKIQLKNVTVVTNLLALASNLRVRYPTWSVGDVPPRTDLKFRRHADIDIVAHLDGDLSSWKFDDASWLLHAKGACLTTLAGELESNGYLCAIEASIPALDVIYRPPKMKSSEVDEWGAILDDQVVVGDALTDEIVFRIQIGPSTDEFDPANHWLTNGRYIVPPFITSPEEVAEVANTYRGVYWRPLHRKEMEVAMVRWPSLEGTLRLLVEWFNAHFLSYGSIEFLESLCLYVYNTKSGTPVTPNVGFFRVLQLLAEYKWDSAPLRIVSTRIPAKLPENASLIHRLAPIPLSDAEAKTVCERAYSQPCPLRNDFYISSLHDPRGLFVAPPTSTIAIDRLRHAARSVVQTVLQQGNFGVNIFRPSAQGISHVIQLLPPGESLQGAAGPSLSSELKYLKNLPDKFSLEVKTLFNKLRDEDGLHVSHEKMIHDAWMRLVRTLGDNVFTIETALPYCPVLIVFQGGQKARARIEQVLDSKSVAPPLDNPSEFFEHFIDQRFR